MIRYRTIRKGGRFAPMQPDNLTLLRLLHQCAHRLSASEKYRGQGRLLILLQEHGPMTQRQLTELTDRRPATLSEQLEKMERTGYLTRVKNEQDRRNIDLALTPSGYGAALEAKADRERRAQVFDRLSPEEKEQLVRILEHLLAVCQADGKPGEKEAGPCG